MEKKMGRSKGTPPVQGKGKNNLKKQPDDEVEQLTEQNNYNNDVEQFENIFQKQTQKISKAPPIFQQQQKPPSIFQQQKPPSIFQQQQQNIFQSKGPKIIPFDEPVSPTSDELLINWLDVFEDNLLNISLFEKVIIYNLDKKVNYNK